MKDLLVLQAHLTTLAKPLGPGGERAVVDDSLLMKQQLLVFSQSRRPAPRLSGLNRILLGFRSLFLSPRRIQRAAVIRAIIELKKGIESAVNQLAGKRYFAVSTGSRTAAGCTSCLRQRD